MKERERCLLSSVSVAWDAAELQKGLCDKHDVSRVLGDVREAKREGTLCGHCEGFGCDPVCNGKPLEASGQKSYTI